MHLHSTRTPQLTQNSTELSDKVIASFWAKVCRGTADVCWPWTGSTDGKGYGKLHVRPKMWSAHRLAWKIHYGALDDNLSVLHRCDNPRCVNPDHLFLGTVADNNADMRAKGRHAHGEKQYRALLTADQVRSIRQKATDGTSLTEIARQMGVSRSSIGAIVRGKLWKHIQDVPLAANRLSHWTDEEVAKMHELLDVGYTQEQVSTMLGKASRAVEGRLYREKLQASRLSIVPPWDVPTAYAAQEVSE